MRVLDIGFVLFVWLFVCLFVWLLVVCCVLFIYLFIFIFCLSLFLSACLFADWLVGGCLFNISWLFVLSLFYLLFHFMLFCFNMRVWQHCDSSSGKYPTHVLITSKHTISKHITSFSSLSRAPLMKHLNSSMFQEHHI